MLRADLTYAYSTTHDSSSPPEPRAPTHPTPGQIADTVGIAVLNTHAGLVPACESHSHSGSAAECEWTTSPVPELSTASQGPSTECRGYRTQQWPKVLDKYVPPAACRANRERHGLCAIRRASHTARTDTGPNPRGFRHSKTSQVRDIDCTRGRSQGRRRQSRCQ